MSNQPLIQLRIQHGYQNYLKPILSDLELELLSLTWEIAFLFLEFEAEIETEEERLREGTELLTW